jgi:hypothetical protein
MFVGHTEINLVGECKAFSGYNLKYDTWGVIRVSTTNVFVRLKTSTEDNLIRLVCPAHVSNITASNMG